MTRPQRPIFSQSLQAALCNRFVDSWFFDKVSQITGFTRHGTDFMMNDRSFLARFGGGFSRPVKSGLNDLLELEAINVRIHLHPQRQMV